MRSPEPLIFEISKPGRRAYSFRNSMCLQGRGELLPESEIRRSLPDCLKCLKLIW